MNTTGITTWHHINFTLWTLLDHTQTWACATSYSHSHKMWVIVQFHNYSGTPLIRTLLGNVKLCTLTGCLHFRGYTMKINFIIVHNKPLHRAPVKNSSSNVCLLALERLRERNLSKWTYERYSFWCFTNMSLELQELVHIFKCVCQAMSTRDLQIASISQNTCSLKRQWKT